MICVAANPSADATFAVGRLERGEIHRPSELVRVAGGKALNVARAAARLGGQARVIMLSPEHGHMWLGEELRREGVAFDAVTFPGRLRSCLSVLDRADGSLTEFYEDGPPIDEASWARFGELVGVRASPGEWLALTGSLPPGAPRDGYRGLTGDAALGGSMAALDASGDALVHGLGAGPALVKVNEAEALAVLGPAGLVDDDPRPGGLAGGLRTLAGPHSCAVVTLGERGAELAGPEGALAASLPARAAAYAVGSGDAFLAGLLTARERDRGWPECLRLAIGAGIANAEEPGPGRLDRGRAETLAAQVEISAVDG